MSLKYYQVVNNYGVQTLPHKVYEEDKSPRPVILDDAKEITLSQYNPLTKDFITAHRIKDYRHKTFTLTLLPQFDLLFNKVLEGSDFFNECLQNARIHT